MSEQSYILINSTAIRENVSLNIFLKEHDKLILSVIAAQSFNFIKILKAHKMHSNKTIIFVLQTVGTETTPEFC